MAVRTPAVAGTFYPADARELSRLVDEFLAAAEQQEPVAAVIAPHAGYIYSGRLAGLAHKQLRRDGVTRVGIVGPSHRVGYDGIAIPAADRWRTPLGEVDVDVPETVRALPGVFPSDRAMALEHSLEVHVPFVQRAFPGASIAPLQVGDADGPTVGAAISALLADPGTVVVVSSDLSHYLPDDVARRIDGETLDTVAHLRGPIPTDRACGAKPINGLIDHARRTADSLRVVGYGTSADTAGDPDRVVGYPAVALGNGTRSSSEDSGNRSLSEDAVRDEMSSSTRSARSENVNSQRSSSEDSGNRSSSEDSGNRSLSEDAVRDEMSDPGAVLLPLARHALDAAVGATVHPLPYLPDWTSEPGATFVTLHLDGRLRGCIGSLEPYRPLATDVVENTKAAALRDPRFPPVTAAEAERILIEVSLLGTPVELPVAGERDAVAQLHRLLADGRREGVILVSGRHRATFLPQVWDELPDPAEFLRHLVAKAGLRAWPADARLLTYPVTAWEETRP